MGTEQIAALVKKDRVHRDRRRGRAGRPTWGEPPMKIDLAPNERTLPALLQRQAEVFGERPLDDDRRRRMGASRRIRSVAARRAGALHAAGIGRGDRVALMCSNRVEILEAFLGCGWIGAVSVPINTASMGPQIEYLLANSGARLLVIEAPFVERLATADLSRTALQAIWVVGDRPAARTRRTASACIALARCAGEPVEAQAGAARRHPRDPLHLRHHRPGQGRDVPACAVLLVGRQHRAHPGHRRRRRALHDLAAVPRQRAQHLCAGGAERVRAWCSSAASRLRASGRPCAGIEATVVYLLGAMVPMLLAQPEGAAERAHRVRIGLGPGVPAAAGEAFERAHRRAPARRLRLDRDQFRDRDRGRLAARAA